MKMKMLKLKKGIIGKQMWQVTGILVIGIAVSLFVMGQSNLALGLFFNLMFIWCGHIMGTSDSIRMIAGTEGIMTQRKLEIDQQPGESMEDAIERGIQKMENDEGGQCEIRVEKDKRGRK